MTELSLSPWHDHGAERLKEILKAAAAQAGADVYVAGGPNDVSTPAGIRKPDVFVVPKDVARSAISRRVRTYYPSDLLLVVGGLPVEDQVADQPVIRQSRWPDVPSEELYPSQFGLGSRLPGRPQRAPRRRRLRLTIPATTTPEQPTEPGPLPRLRIRGELLQERGLLIVPGLTHGRCRLLPAGDSPAMLPRVVVSDAEVVQRFAFTVAVAGLAEDVDCGLVGVDGFVEPPDGSVAH